MQFCFYPPPPHRVWQEEERMEGLRSRGKLEEGPKSSEMGCVMSLWQEKQSVCRFLHPPGCFICSQANFLFLISQLLQSKAELLAGLFSEASPDPLWLSIFQHLWLLLHLAPWFYIDTIFLYVWTL